MISDPFPALVVRRAAAAEATAAVEMLTLDQLPPGEVVIQVACSSLNYKDALAATGHPGVVRRFPHVPGIDCAGSILQSSGPDWKPGDRVLVTGYQLGAERWGGFSGLVRVPADWPVLLPDDVSPEEAMSYGTAGFTAAQCVDALRHHGIDPSQGTIVVTGATGGVGSLAVALLAQLGYRVAAVTGKADQHERLRALGAAEILPREEVCDTSDRALLSGRWAGGVDTVGGQILATLLRQLTYRGCVAACGLTAGADLPLTVHPFILRGAHLAGIDSAKSPRPHRLAMWQHLFGPWRLPQELIAPREVSLTGLPHAIGEMLAGRGLGRVLVRPTT